MNADTETDKRADDGHYLLTITIHLSIHINKYIYIYIYLLHEQVFKFIVRFSSKASYVILKTVLSVEKARGGNM